MPIKSENRHKYPPEWPLLRRVVLHRARHMCEGSPAYPDSRAVNYAPHPVTGSRVVLTVAHMDRALVDHGLANLKALCQRCHLNHDRKRKPS